MIAFLINSKKINFYKKDSEFIKPENISVKNGNNQINIDKMNFSNNCIEILLKNSINIKYISYIIYENNDIKINYCNFFDSDEFNDKYYYDGTLGAIYEKKGTCFKLWSPAAQSVDLLLYKYGDPAFSSSCIKIPMAENEKGLWITAIRGNFEGYYYNYLVNVYDNESEIVDPYAKAVGINGLRGAIINFDKTSIKGWNADKGPEINSYTDSIIYEISIRDMSSFLDSGIKNRKLFLGLSEENTVSSKNVTTGLNHIKELGVTHVQVMPSFDFSYGNADEKNPSDYNWGYNPVNYNVPEGSYSTDPFDPYVRIREMKKMIVAFHKKGIGVNMDVVFNHTANIYESSFEKSFPGYFFRTSIYGTYANGSGCGNDTASERKMFRKYMIDSVLFWAHEYHIDGFRFDLMGLHDIETMKTIKKRLDSSGKKYMVYGEGWDLDTPLPDSEKSTIENSYKIPQIGFFNDKFRDSVKGNVFCEEERGFISGKEGLENEICKDITGSIDYSEDVKGPFVSPEQSINYVSCHDNLTLWDKIEKSVKNADINTKKSMAKLAIGITLTSQGVPFLHSGIDFCRTKNGESNSYNLPDKINCMDWDRKYEFMDVFNYTKGLIKLRNEHPAFRMKKAEDIRKNIEFLKNTPKNTVAFLIKNHANGDLWENIIVIYNGNFQNVKIHIPYKNINVCTDENTSGDDILYKTDSDEIEIKPLSLKVMFN